MKYLRWNSPDSPAHGTVWKVIDEYTNNDGIVEELTPGSKAPYTVGYTVNTSFNYPDWEKLTPYETMVYKTLGEIDG